MFEYRLEVNNKITLVKTVTNRSKILLPKSS